MVVPSTADEFKTAASALRSLDWKEGVSFQTFTILEGGCRPLLVENLGRGMPESVIREEGESLNIRAQGVMQLRPVRRDQDPAKDRIPTPTSLYRWSEGLRCRKCDNSHNSPACECR
jgi:hypothetical protein